MKLATLLTVTLLPVLAFGAPAPEFPIQTQLDTAHTLRKHGQPVPAREIYAHIVADQASTPHARSEAQVWLGHVLRDQGKLDEAIEAYSKVLFLPGANPHHIS
jgi:hypothetical protein